MNNWQTALKTEMIAQEFEDVGEDLEADLSGVHVKAVRDVHDGGVELEIYVFGKGLEENEPPVVHVPIPMSSGLFDDEADLEETVSPASILKLFDDSFLKLVNQKGLKIIWNPGWPTEAVIFPADGSSSSLYPQDQ